MLTQQWLWLLALLQLAALAYGHGIYTDAGGIPPPGGIALVRQHPQPGDGSVTFIQALQNQSVGTIQLLEDITLDPQEWAPFQRDTHHLPIMRDVLIIGAPHNHSAAEAALSNSTDTDPVATLDFNYIGKATKIAPGKTMILRDIGLARQRAVSGSYIDLFQAAAPPSNVSNAPLTVVALHDVYRFRQACPPPEVSLAARDLIPRPPGFPGNQTIELLGNGSVWHRGRQYASAVRLVDFTELAPGSWGVDEAHEYHPDYIVVHHNTTWLCERVATPECLQRYGRDGCLQRMTDDMNHGGDGSLSNEARGAAAAISTWALAAMLGAALLGGLA